MMTTSPPNVGLGNGAISASPLAMGYIGKAFEALGAGLSPMVTERLQAAVNSGKLDPRDWENAGLFRDNLDIAKIRAGDAYAVLGVMAEGWFRIPFHNIELAPGQKLGHAEHGLVSNLFEFRNNAFHQGRYDDSDAILMLGMASRLLRAFAAYRPAGAVAQYQTDLGKRIFAPAPPAAEPTAPPPALPANAIVTTREALAELISNAAGRGMAPPAPPAPPPDAAPSPTVTSPTADAGAAGFPTPSPQPDASYWESQGDDHFRKGEHTLAVASYTRAIALGDNNPAPDGVIWRKRGEAHNANGEHEQARLDFDRAIDLNPDGRQADLA